MWNLTWVILFFYWPTWVILGPVEGRGGERWRRVQEESKPAEKSLQGRVKANWQEKSRKGGSQLIRKVKYCRLWIWILVDFDKQSETNEQAFTWRWSQRGHWRARRGTVRMPNALKQSHCVLCQYFTNIVGVFKDHEWHFMLVLTRWIFVWSDITRNIRLVRYFLECLLVRYY